MLDERFMVMMSDPQGFPSSPCWFLGTDGAALLHTGTRLNSPHAFGNRRPLIGGADGQRCPSPPSVCSQIDACATATLRGPTDGKHGRPGVRWCVFWQTWEERAREGDRHATVGTAGSGIDSFERLACDGRFLCETLLTHGAHQHTPLLKCTLTLPVYPPLRHPTSWLPTCFHAPLRRVRFRLKLHSCRGRRREAE